MDLKQLLFAGGVISIVLLYGFGGAYGEEPFYSSMHELRSFSDHAENLYEESLNLNLNVQDTLDQSRDTILTENLKAEVLSAIDTGVWQNITLPAVISAPGKYRITNNYTAVEGAESGIIINNSQVIIDGYGHSFSGNDILGSIGVVVSGNDSVRYDHISIGNLSLLQCNIGIQFDNVDSAMIMNTTHIGNHAGIVIGQSARVGITDYSILDGKRGVLGGYGILASDTDNICILNGRIQNSNQNLSEIPYYGILLRNESGQNNIIWKNQISGQRISAIESSEGEENLSGDLRIINNTISGSAGVGIDIRRSHPNSHASIIWNTISGCGNGMDIAADDSFIIGNQVTDSGLFGIITEGQNCWISNNTMTNNPACLGMYGDTIGYFLHTMYANIADGRPILYIKNETNVTIGPEDDPAMVIVAQSSNVTVHDISTTHAGTGNLLVGVNDLLVQNVTDTGSWEGIVLYQVREAEIKNCSAEKNEIGHSAYYSSNFKFINCSDSGARYTGMLVSGSDLAKIYRCIVDNVTPTEQGSNAFGILSQDSNNITIENTSVSESAGQGISLVNMSMVNLTNTFIEKSGRSGFVSENSSEIIVKRSLMVVNQQNGINLLNSVNVTLNRNYIMGNNEAGIDMVSTSDSLIADNFLNNSVNTVFYGNNLNNRWNTTLTTGENIMSGPYLGGNFWAAPDGTGFSQTHADRGDGICNATNILTAQQIDYLPLAEFSPPLVPDFTSDVYSGTPPLTVQFQDNTTGEVAGWNWTFGDGKSSTERSPLHVYTGIGRYTVTMEVSGPHGEQGAVRKPGFIWVNNGRVTGPNGMIWMSSSPSGARVFVDNVFIGETPLRSSGIPAGIRQIRVSSEGYRNWIGYVQINQGGFTYIPKVVLAKL